MINLNTNISGVSPSQMPLKGAQQPEKNQIQNSFKKYLEGVDENQATADTSIKDLLAGKNQDINSVVAEVAEADMSFKLLVGVRNKIVEAYKQTMNMQI